GQTMNAGTYYDLVISTTGTATAPSGITTVIDTVTVNIGSTLVVTGTLALTGVLINNTTLTATGTNSTIIMQGTSVQTLGSVITANQISNLVINNAAGVMITP